MNILESIAAARKNADAKAPADLSQVKADFIAALTAYRDAKANLTAAIIRAVEAGATAADIRAWAKESKVCTPQNVNLALRKAGIRTRGVRSDAGVARLVKSVDTFFDASEGEDDEEKEEKPEKDVVTKLMQYALNVCGGDAEKARATLAVAADKLANPENGVAK